ncbi:MAG: hypothetical protein R3A52_11130 [Polyangiales bacterium]
MNRALTVAALGCALALGCESSTPAEPNANTTTGTRPVARVPATPVEAIPGHESLAQDTTPKHGPRLVPVEAYLRTYLTLFGGLAPLDAQTRLRGADSARVFDTWADYVSALGLPDYRVDLPRTEQTNALMVATFERVGAALCDRAAERDLHTPTPLAERAVFTFELPSGELTDAAFAERLDALHRTFLGYPLRLAPADREGRFRTLYRETVARHSVPRPPASRLSPAEAGWSAVCHGLVRHPEFHLY